VHKNLKAKMGFSEENHEKIEKAFAFLTGNHFINYHYGAILSKSLKVLPVTDFDAQEIAPNLFLGDVYAAHNSRELKNRNITHIVTCTVGVSPPYPESFKYMHLQILDFAGEPINEHFAKTYEFIADALDNGGKVLVHCIRGVSRSATIVTAFLMKHMSMSAEDAVNKVQGVRPIARPNYGFMMQLQLYGKDLQKGINVEISEEQNLPSAEW
jgi:protein-tyrosine phosphatase